MKLKYYNSKKLKKKIKKQLKLIIDTVGSTLGPKGNNVLLDINHYSANPIVTKDGITVLKNLGSDTIIKLIRQASNKTVEECGDGTTSTAILASGIYLESLKYKNNNKIFIKNGIDKLKNKLLDLLTKKAIELKTDEQIRNIATISANNDEYLGDIITKAFKQAYETSNKPNVSVELGKKLTDELVQLEGYKIERGYVSAHFIKDQSKNYIEFKNPLIFVSNYEFNSSQQIIKILEYAHTKNKPLLIISNGGNAEVLNTLLVNNHKGILDVCAVESPGFGERRDEYLKDIAVITGAKFINNTEDINRLDLESIFGTCQSVKIKKNETILISPNKNESEFKSRIELLNILIEEAETEYDKEQYKDRLEQLEGQISIIKVGAASETEAQEKRDRIEDAIGAVNAAIQEGIIIGSGTALIKLCDSIDIDDLDIKNEDELIGVKILAEAIKYPFKKIVQNAGFNEDIILEKLLEIKEFENGFNAKTGEFINLYESGVIDPVKVIKSVLNNAVSIGTMLITSSSMLININKINE